jgi:hypothetical protein
MIGADVPNAARATPCRSAAKAFRGRISASCSPRRVAPLLASRVGVGIELMALVFVVLILGERL